MNALTCFVYKENHKKLVSKTEQGINKNIQVFLASIVLHEIFVAKTFFH